jgi:hypothetical protein
MRSDTPTGRRSHWRPSLYGAASFAIACVLPGTLPAQQPAAAGDYKPEATLAELMELIVMPAADVVWNSVAVNVTIDGVEEHVPQTDEEWAAVRGSAMILAEAPNLLVMPGRAIDEPGAVSEAPDVELGPAEIEKLIASNRAAWVGHARALQATAQEALKAIDARDVDAITEVGGAIDAACESCHVQFWYPNQ